MEQNITIFTADGTETLFGADTKINFDRDGLLIRVQNESITAGWHWDHFAGMIQRFGKIADQISKQSCEVLLRFNNHQEKSLIVSAFINFELNLSNNFLKIKGQQETAVINLDFVHWYRTFR